MSEQSIEDFIDEVLAGDAQKNALEFISYLRDKNMKFERGKGYWENQLYWMVKFNNDFVCFILISNDPEEKGSSWIVWSDDSASNWFEDFPLDEHLKEIAWRSIDFCENCGSCSGGTSKVIFGKKFIDVCTTTFRFDDPDDETLEFMKKMVETRKNDVLMKNRSAYSAR